MELTAYQIDVMREIGNIGMGNAATSLSVMMNNAVSMTIPKVHILDEEETRKMTDELYKDSYAIYLTLTEGLDGYIIHFMKTSFAEKIISTFFPTSITAIEDIDEMGKSIIAEMGNITSASYINSIASFSGITIDISTPNECSNLISDTNFFDKEGKKLIYVDTSFFIEEDEIKSALFFAPDEESIEKLISALKI